MIQNGTAASALHGASWRKSSASQGTSNCAELARLSDGSVGVRQNTDAAGPALVFTPGEFDAFAAGAKAGEFDDLLIS